MFTENGYTLWLFDRRDNPPAGYTVYDIADDTAAVMTALGIENASVFGASQGGMAAMLLAAGYPEKVRNLVVASSLCSRNATFDAVVEKWTELALGKDAEALVNAFGETVFSQAFWGKYGDIVINMNRDITDAEFEKMIIMSRAMDGFDARESLKKIKCPALVIGSEGDRVVTPEGTREIAEILGCELYMYPAQYGHAVYDEAPGFAQKCFEFINKTEAING